MNKSTTEERKPRLDTKNLLVSELTEGRMYRCHLAMDREVLYIGNGEIKWWNQEHDQYRTSPVADYQLKPLVGM